MRLNELLSGLGLPGLEPAIGEIDIQSVCTDSRKATERSLFIALPGEQKHGKEFIREAAAKGACVIIHDQPDFDARGVPCLFVRVADVKVFLREACRFFYDDPSQTLKVIGVTGTNGKTTFTYLLEAIFNRAGLQSGVIGTVNYRIGDKMFPSTNTTPGVVQNFELLGRMRHESCQYAIVEVSSHALKQDRVMGINFRYAVFTNLTSDHLDYHKDLEDYFSSKAKLFSTLKGQSLAVINQDDPRANRLKILTRVPVRTYALRGPADVVAEEISADINGSKFKIRTGEKTLELKTFLVGQHNIYNILAAATVAQAERIDDEAIRSGIESCRYIPGRMERVPNIRGIHVFVDYAHTEDGLNNVLSSLTSFKKGKLILVFGCGGDRDQSKRPRMGKVASCLADISILTNDNPRCEDPEKICGQILEGFDRAKEYCVILDRKEAIEHALGIAKRDDIVLVAGKGHENYQIFKDRRESFDDRQVVQQFFGA